MIQVRAILLVMAVILIGFLISLLLPVLADIGALTLVWLIYKLIAEDVEDEDEKKPP